jgi:hypothetical protein
MVHFLDPHVFEGRIDDQNIRLVIFIAGVVTANHLRRMHHLGIQQGAASDALKQHVRRTLSCLALPWSGIMGELRC